MYGFIEGTYLNLIVKISHIAHLNNLAVALQKLVSKLELIIFLQYAIINTTSSMKIYNT